MLMMMMLINAFFGEFTFDNTTDTAAAGIYRLACWQLILFNLPILDVGQEANVSKMKELLKMPLFC